MQKLGAGELLVNSIGADGTKSGFDTNLLAAIRAEVDIPIIASGGAGEVSHFLEAGSKPEPMRCWPRVSSTSGS